MSSQSPPAKKRRPQPAPKPQPPDEPEATSLPLRLADWGLIAIFIALTFLLGIFPLKDTDFWFHLRTGDWIRQNGRVPTTDLYTYTVPKAPWIDLHWGFQVAISWVYERWGIVGLNLAKCVVTSAAVFLLVTARRRSWPVWAMLLAWLPALLLLSGRMYVRPETLSLLYLSMFLAVVSRWDRWPWLAMTLPAVQLIWVNCHGLFILGPIVLTFGLIDAALRPGAFGPGQKRWWRIIGMACGLSFVLCLANPYGLIGALYPLQLAQTMRNPMFSKGAFRIAELTPIPVFIEENGLRNLPLQIHLVTVFVGALSFLVPLFWAVRIRMAPVQPGEPAKNEIEKASGKDKGKAQPAKKPRKSKAAAKAADSPVLGVSPLRLLLFGAFTYLSWQATRNSHQFAAVAGTITAWNFGEWAAAIRKRRWPSQKTPAGYATAHRVIAFVVLAAVFGLVASGQFYAAAGEGRTIGLGEEPLWYPHGAAKFAGRAEMPPHILTYHNGYAPLYEYYNGPERKVYADARLEVIGADMYYEYSVLCRQITSGEKGWEDALDAIQRPAVLVGAAPTDTVMAGSLMASQHWRCVWFDPVAWVFVHDSYRGAVAAHAVDFAARRFRPSKETEPVGLPALVASARALTICAAQLTANKRANKARALIHLGLAYARRIEHDDPKAVEGWKFEGQLERARDPLGEQKIPRFRMPLNPAVDLPALRATYAFRRAVEAAPNDFMSLLELGGMLFEKERGMHEAALPYIDRLCTLHPINQLQRKMQDAYVENRPMFVAQLGPAPPTTWENLSDLDQKVSKMLDAGRVESAAEFLEKAYPETPRPWDVADRLATLRLHLGEPARARTLWMQTAPKDPALRPARVALTHLIEGNFDEARKAYAEAVKADPKLFEAHYGLAVLEQDDGRAAEALAEARRAIETAPDASAQDAVQKIADDVEPYAKP